MEVSERIIDPDSLAPAEPEMMSVLWSGMTIIWRRAPFTPEAIKMPTTGVGVSFIGDANSHSRKGFGDTNVRRLEPGSVFVFADDDFIWEQNVTPYAGVALGFDETFLKDFAERVDFGGPINLRSSHFHADERMIAITKLMAAEIRSSGLGGAIYQEALVALAGVHLLRNYAGAEEAGRHGSLGLTSVKLKLIGDYVADNLAAAIRLEELADLAGMSAFHFARSFREVTGRPPHRYVVEIRMARARELLTTSSLSVNEIAWRVGYANPSHFSKQFKRAFGITPGRFRSHL